MFQPVHGGLYFTDEHIRQAREQRNTEPFRTAWAALHQRRQVDLLALAQWQGLLYRFDDDAEAGARAVGILQQDDLMPSNPASNIERVAAALAQAQCFEMVRNHPEFTQSAGWMQQFAAIVEHLNRAADDWLYTEQVWLNALNLAAGIVLEEEALFVPAADMFREIIRYDIHPEGYIRKAAQGQPRESLMRMLLAAQALILMAEMASHAGEDLWAFNERRVSALTPMPYLLYYYYYPEKWRWDAEAEADGVPEEGESRIEIEAAQALYKRHAGMWEMAQRQSWSKDRQVLLDEIRPVYDLWGGGLVTLTHGAPEQRRKRFGLFSL
jgi:hypothetical protein